MRSEFGNDSIAAAVGYDQRNNKADIAVGEYFMHFHEIFADSNIDLVIRPTAFRLYRPIATRPLTNIRLLPVCSTHTIA